MSQEWYVYQDGQEKGPYTWEQLWHLARAGRLTTGDSVWTEGMSEWAYAGEIGGLTAIPAGARVPPPPPALGTAAPPARSIATPTVPHQGGAPKARVWRLVAALAGAVLLVMVGCAAGYLLVLRDRGLPASPTATAAVTTVPASTTPTPDLGEGEQERQEGIGDAQEPTEQPTEQTVAESPTELPDVDEADQQTVRPTDEPTLEPTQDAEPEESSPEPLIEPTGTSDVAQPGLPTPRAVVEEFILSTLGTVPGSAVDYDRARALMTVAYAAEFDSPEFVPLTYGIQEGPTSYEIAAEEVSGSTATVQVLGYWAADPGREWRFFLEEEAGLWRVAGIEVLEAGQPAGGEEAQSPFWQLSPVLEEFTVSQNGSWKLVVAFDQPGVDIGANFRIEYRREDDGSLAYSQESSGVITADRVRLTLDSDWTGYDLYGLGFRSGEHRVEAYIDGVRIATSEFVVN